MQIFLFRNYVIFTITLLVASIEQVSISAAFQDPLVRVVQLDDPAGYYLGGGYNLVTGAPRADCVDRAGEVDSPTTAQDDIAFQSREITSFNSLNDILNVSASAQLSGGFGGGSATASFAKAVNVEEYSLYYAVTSELKSGGKRLRDVRLKPEFVALLQTDDPNRFQRFRTLCGDGYIGELVMGADFKAIIRIKTSSRSDRESISAEASFSMTTSSGTASFSRAVTKLANSREVNAWSIRRGGNGTPIAIAPAEIADQASKLPEIAKTAQVVTGMVVNSYLMLISDPKVKLQDFAAIENKFRMLASINANATERMARLKYIYDHPEEFYGGPYDLPKLASEIRELASLQSAISDRAEKCFSSEEECVVDDLILPSAIIRPARK